MNDLINVGYFTGRVIKVTILQKCAKIALITNGAGEQGDMQFLVAIRKRHIERFSQINTGELITVKFHLMSNIYTDENGKEHFTTSKVIDEFRKEGVKIAD